MTNERVAMTDRIVGVKHGGTVVAHDRPQRGVLGLIDELVELFVGHRQIVSGAAKVLCDGP